MSMKSYRILLSCLIPFLYLFVTGCATGSLLAAKKFSTQGTGVPKGEKIARGTAQTLLASNSPSARNQGKESTASKQIKNPSNLHSMSLKKSSPPATDFNPADQPGVEIIDSPPDDAQETGQEDANSAETNAANDQQEKLDSALQMCQEAQKQWEEGNPDGAMETLDSAYELLISVDPDDDADLLQQKDDIRFLLSKRTVEIYASRQHVTDGTHREIPLTMNAHVQREIDSFLGIEREHFLESYKRSGLYRPMIVKELTDAGLPTKLSWLPLIESYFKDKAFSRARALGLWQFIPSTGCKFGLRRDKWVDERMDPEKSTKAAIEYLKQLHQMFGDWTTVLAAYNCGEGTVLRVIRNQTINYLDNFWDLYARLPQETARYVPRFLAAIQIIEDPNRFGIELDQPISPPEYEEVTVNRQVPLKGLAAKLGIDGKILTDLNPELRYQVTPAYEYHLKVPPNTGSQVLASLDAIPEWTPPSEPADTPVRVRPKPRYTVMQAKPKPEPEYVVIRLKQGETLHRLAKKYGVDVGSITKVNNIKNIKHLQAGQQIRIPLKQNQALAKNSSTSSSSSSNAKSNAKANAKSNAKANAKANVKSNANANANAKSNANVDVKANAKSNANANAKSNVNVDAKSNANANVDAKSNVNAKSNANAKSKKPSLTRYQVYYVKKGDYPAKIAKKHKVELDEFLKLNRLSSGSTLQPGQRVLVKMN